MMVEIWSDVVCPWCYIGKRRFEAALAGFEHADAVQVHWRAFELDPGATSAAPGHVVGPHDHAAMLAAKYGASLEQAQAMDEQMTAAAAAEGLTFHLDAAVPANTADAHQVIHLAGLRGGPALADAAKERLLRAYFTDGEAVGDTGVLVRLAGEVGLDHVEVRSVLDSGAHLDAVRADEAEAAALGAGGVPFFVIDRRYGVSGAQPAEQLRAVLARAFSESRSLTLVGAAGSPAGAPGTDAPGDAAPGDAAACGPDGCAI